jgi:hypothetical protein
MTKLNTPTIIGLTGLAGSGKDTVADLLICHVGFQKLAFADKLRAEVCEAFGIEPLLLTHRATKEEPHKALSLGMCKDHGLVGALLHHSALDHEDGTHSEILARPRSPRQIMQWWGTEHRRSQHANYWTWAVTARINDGIRRGHMAHVITDVRFENEAETVRNMGGTIWQIKRPAMRPITADDYTKAEQASHVSEVDGSQFAPDVVINNSHDIRHLQSVVMGAWLMGYTGMSAQEICNMGLAHTDMACQQWGTYGKALATKAQKAA